MALIATLHHTIIQKHPILYFFKVIKFFFLLLIIMIIGGFAFYYKTEILDTHPYIMYFFIVPILFFFLNYIFIKLILETIVYFHDLLILYKDKIVIIKNSFFLQSDLEIIDVYRIMKLNITCHGMLANMIGYGDIRIEQQNDDVKTIHFVPRPEKIVELLEIRRSTIIANRGKTEKPKSEEKAEAKKDKNYWERTQEN